MSAIAKKIQALLAVADSTTHPEEADAFMRKAHAIMVEHGITLVELGKLGEDPLGEDTQFGHNSANDAWRGDVGAALARYYGCNVVYSGRVNQRWTVFGRESARVTFAIMWPYVDRRVMELARREHKLGKYPTVMQARRRIGNALCFRILDMYRAQTVPHQGNGVNALVPVDLIDQLMKQRFPDLVEGKKKSLSTDRNAVSVAQEVNLDHQVGGEKRVQLAQG